jgi:hypothetical protein
VTTGIKDTRHGQGRVLGEIVQPAHTIPADCMCTWSIRRAGIGKAAVSYLRYRNSLCPNRHEEKEKQDA